MRYAYYTAYLMPAHRGVLGSHHGVGRISQSLLSARLRSLETAGVIERRPNPFGRGSEDHPTRAGRELETVLNELGIWAQHWIELRQEDCDPAYLMQIVPGGLYVVPGLHHTVRPSPMRQGSHRASRSPVITEDPVASDIGSSAAASYSAPCWAR